jgi:hypothetical protein
MSVEARERQQERELKNNRANVRAQAPEKVKPEKDPGQEQALGRLKTTAPIWLNAIGRAQEQITLADKTQIS